MRGDRQRQSRTAQLVKIFKEHFEGKGKLVEARAPGRVNLIGEHTDYNDGFVLPMAIDRDIRIVGRSRADRQVQVFSADFEALNSFSLDDIQYDYSQRWSNYVRGVYDVLIKEGYTVVGADMVISGDVPQGAGLSSSAALEVATATFIQEVAGLQIEPGEVVKLAQRAENQFVGVNCGIMDQFISRLAQEGHALFLDCRDLSYRQIPLSDENVKVVVANTNVKRGLVDSEYNVRRAQCQEGVRLLSEVLPGVRALRDVSYEDFTKYKVNLPGVVARRCAHVITENERVLDSINALKKGDLGEFGRLMNESHASLRDFYEVSCRELDVLVEIAQDVEGVYGSRMTGAGFGGCTVSLVESEAVAELEKRFEEEYSRRTGKQPSVFVFQPASGATVRTDV